MKTISKARRSGLIAAMMLGLVSHLPAKAADVAYVTDFGGGVVTAIYVPTNSVIATIPVGVRLNPTGVAVSHSGRSVYAGITGSLTDSGVVVIDPLSNNVITIIQTAAGVRGVAVSPDDKVVYAAVNSQDSVAVIDTVNNTVIASIPIGGSPWELEVTPDNTAVYVANEDSNAVSVIDTASLTVVATIAVGAFPQGVAITPDGAAIYVTNARSDSVSVIDTASNTVSATIPVGGAPLSLAASLNGSHVYVTNYFGNSVSVIETATNTVISTIPVGDRPWGVAMTSDGSSAYVNNYGANSISVIDIATHTVSTTFPVGAGLSAYGEFIGSIPVATLKMGVVKAICRNLDTRQSVIVPGNTSLNCEAAGLVVQPGQRVDVILKGTAE